MDDQHTSTRDARLDDLRTLPAPGLRIAGHLGSDVVVALERRLALLDELDTLADRRVELTRSAQLLGGHDDGSRPAPDTNGDPRHRLDRALHHLTRLEGELEAAKLAVSEARR